MQAQSKIKLVMSHRLPDRETACKLSEEMVQAVEPYLDILEEYICEYVSTMKFQLLCWVLNCAMIHLIVYLALVKCHLQVSCPMFKGIFTSFLVKMNKIVLRIWLMGGL